GPAVPRVKRGVVRVAEERSVRGEAAVEIPAVVVAACAGGRAGGEALSRVERPVGVAKVVEVDDDIAPPGARGGQGDGEAEECWEGLAQGYGWLLGAGSIVRSIAVG